MSDLNQANVVLAALLKATSIQEFVNYLIADDTQVNQWTESNAFGVFSADRMITPDVTSPAIKTPEDVIYLPTPLGGIRIELKHNRKQGKIRNDVRTYSNTFVDFITAILGLEERSRFAIKSMDDLRHVYLRAFATGRTGQCIKQVSNNDPAFSTQLTEHIAVIHLNGNGYFRTVLKLPAGERELPAEHASLDKYFKVGTYVNADT